MVLSAAIEKKHDVDGAVFSVLNDRTFHQHPILQNIVLQLLQAATKGSAELVETILQKGGVNPDCQGIHGRTALAWAARNGHGTVVKVLLNTDMVDVNLKDEFQSSPLSLAAAYGREAVVKLL